MAIPTTPFDAAKYLTDAESQLELLNEALDTKSAPVVVHAIRTIVRARGIAEPTTKLDIDPTALSEVVAEGPDPTIAATLAVLHGLGFELQARIKSKAT
ncbi:helix-turn-helix domain-containing transcriptional regulator [Sphingomonas sp. 8AM]|uniref:helix-turn-helix domain-containing transcriptional regulator n=1 Tax=Sphingomonas sp. 8AM TaxID=2653170 RepID=UPI0012F381E8|nr:transcriptional regulator [Sphingomonas sp. 8AM]VXC42437.1 conserved hypothetical protein [Sphingomonas sp. 8AM]